MKYKKTPPLIGGGGFLNCQAIQKDGGGNAENAQFSVIL
jgi:hypothetical protein